MKINKNYFENTQMTSKVHANAPNIVKLANINWVSYLNECLLPDSNLTPFTRCRPETLPVASKSIRVKYYRLCPELKIKSYFGLFFRFVAKKLLLVVYLVFFFIYPGNSGNHDNSIIILFVVKLKNIVLRKTTLIQLYDAIYTPQLIYTVYVYNVIT